MHNRNRFISTKMHICFCSVCRFCMADHVFSHLSAFSLQKRQAQPIERKKIRCTCTVNPYEKSTVVCKKSFLGNGCDSLVRAENWFRHQLLDSLLCAALARINTNTDLMQNWSSVYELHTHFVFIWILLFIRGFCCALSTLFIVWLDLCCFFSFCAQPNDRTIHPQRHMQN